MREITGPFLALFPNDKRDDDELICQVGLHGRRVAGAQVVTKNCARGNHVIFSQSTYSVTHLVSRQVLLHDLFASSRRNKLLVWITMRKYEPTNPRNFQQNC